MARRGRPTAVIVLSDVERETLQRWVRRHRSAQALALRARIVLGCAEGGTNREVAAVERVNPATVSKWRRRFAADRLEGLSDAPRPGAERTIADERIEAVVVDTLESTPPDATHWSTRSLAAKHGISKTTVAEIWRAFGLKPWKQDSFKVSPDPDLVEKVRDLVGLYLNPPEVAAVFAVDEKPQIQALNRTAPTLPMLPATTVLAPAVEAGVVSVLDASLIEATRLHGMELCHAASLLGLSYEAAKKRRRRAEVAWVSWWSPEARPTRSSIGVRQRLVA